MTVTKQPSDDRLDEPQMVLAWRAEALARAGYPAEEAFLLAERDDVDLHQAIYLLESGCPVGTAVRILT